MSHVGFKAARCLCEGILTVVIICIKKGWRSREKFPPICISFGRTTAENKHLMLLLCKWTDWVYSVGPVNAELDIVTLRDSRASGNLLIWAATGRSCTMASCII